MRRLAVLVIIATALALVSGCGPVASGQPDDIVITPGGPAYRANVHQQGLRNPWPEIQTKTVVLADNVSVNYRADIETKAGETRNNIVFASMPGFHESPELALSFSDIPDGIEVKDDGGGMARPGVADEELSIVISGDVKPGEYTFEIGIEFNGKDYGTLPCTIKVAKN